MLRLTTALSYDQLSQESVVFFCTGYYSTIYSKKYRKVIYLNLAEKVAVIPLIFIERKL